MYTAHIFVCIGLGYMNQAEDPNFLPQTFLKATSLLGIFGASSEIFSQLWGYPSQTEINNRLACPKHLLWALVFLNMYTSKLVLVAKINNNSKMDAYFWQQNIIP